MSINPVILAAADAIAADHLICRTRSEAARRDCFAKDGCRCMETAKAVVEVVSPLLEDEAHAWLASRLNG